MTIQEQINQLQNTLNNTDGLFPATVDLYNQRINTLKNKLAAKEAEARLE